MCNETVIPADKEPYRRTVDEVLASLGADVRSGLSQDEAQVRLEQYGRNELTAEPAVPEWRKFLAQFTDTLVILLMIAGAASAGLWVYERDTALPYEAIAIFAIVLLNALMGYFQQARAEQAVTALRKMSAARAEVIRGGARQSLIATDLAPGDVILVEEGDRIPADARLIESTMLQTAEAALTGESLPISKDVAAIAEPVGLGDRRNMIFSGTTASYGHGRAVVTATGMQTEMGRIAGMLKQPVKETTPLEKELDRVGKALAVVVVIIAVVTVGTILLVEDVGGFSAVRDVVILGVALAVAAAPEGLPVVVTTVLSLGVRRMAERNAIVRRLAAVETLGSTNVIASDKTGTFTRNEITVRVVVTASGDVFFSGAGYLPEGAVSRAGGKPIDGAVGSELARALTVADRANNATLEERDGRWTVRGDPTEGALIVAARKAGLEQTALGARFARVGELPFSSERKLMSTIHSDAERPEQLLVMAKGAPDVLLALCARELVDEDSRPLTADRRSEILGVNEGLANDALRTLGVAFRSMPNAGSEPQPFDDVERDLVFVGLIGMMDPPREEAREAIARAKRAGIRTIMITGDHPRTASVIASELGVAAGSRTVTGSELQRLSDETLDRTVRDVSVYARVDPEHKLRIVKALQRGGMTVAMTGDGVNDAPALKAADIGIAMGVAGTDVSKEAADMVLADDNFATIVAAVEEGRTIFSNIRKFLRYLLSSNIGEVLTMFFGVLLADVIGLTAANGVSRLALPLLATQILWINLVTDGAPALALGLDPADAGTMNKPPRPRDEGVITRRMWAGIFFVGVVMAAGTLFMFDASLPGGLIEGAGTIAYAQTMTFTTLVLFQLFNVFNARSDTSTAFGGLFTNRWLWAAVALSLALQAAVVYLRFLQVAFSTVALSLRDWIWCAAVSSSVLWLREISKAVARAREA